MIPRTNGNCNLAFSHVKKNWFTIDETSSLVEFDSNSAKLTEMSSFPEDLSVLTVASNPCFDDIIIGCSSKEVYRINTSGSNELIHRCELDITKVQYSDDGKHL